MMEEKKCKCEKAGIIITVTESEYTEKLREGISPMTYGSLINDILIDKAKEFECSVGPYSYTTGFLPTKITKNRLSCKCTVKPEIMSKIINETMKEVKKKLEPLEIKEWTYEIIDCEKFCEE